MGTQKDQMLQIQQAFEKAQKGHQNLAKLVAGLKQIYNQDEDKNMFHEEFINLLKYPMTIYKREPAVERIIEFVAKFVTSFEEPGDEESDEENSFMLFLFRFLLKSHNACSHSVRFRACQLINKLLGSMSENAQIDDELYDRIYEAMLVRLKDKFPNVRIQAVFALSRLQDPTDENCPVIDAYLHLIECDTNPEVRRAVLSCIGPSAQTLSKIIGRTMDVKENVRKLAYEVLAEKIHIKAFSIAQRVKLLTQGLADRSDAVKEVVQKKLLPAWLRTMEGNVLDLLHRLDVENCVTVAESALNSLFAQTPLEDLVEKFQNLNHGKVISAESLTCENALYWRCLCNYMKSMEDEREEALEKLLPETAVYAAYLLSYLKNLPILNESQRADFAQIEDVMKKEFICQQLIILVGCLDTSEEGGRKCLLSVLQEILILPNTPSSLIALLMEQLLSIQKEDDRRIRLNHITTTVKLIKLDLGIAAGPGNWTETEQIPAQTRPQDEPKHRPSTNTERHPQQSPTGRVTARSNVQLRAFHNPRLPGQRRLWPTSGNAAGSGHSATPGQLPAMLLWTEIVAARRRSSFCWRNLLEEQFILHRSCFPLRLVLL
ncbi:condensin complex subunit 3-like [Rhincodon typus]|uniref:condensin complex subunit 3-like n=1 Tax=Rhincodon typus TaxID=259920 RepID=UPI00202DC8A6|nr:condensin complex subunit 3-like [Rhincodon typus]